MAASLPTWSRRTPTTVASRSYRASLAALHHRSESDPRRVGRDVKAVHRDVTALIEAGVLRRAPEGGIEFPFDAVKVEFMLRAASICPRLEVHGES